MQKCLVTSLFLWSRLYTKRLYFVEHNFFPNFENGILKKGRPEMPSDSRKNLENKL